jgi:hypothetical protein
MGGRTSRFESYGVSLRVWSHVALQPALRFVMCGNHMWRFNSGRELMIRIPEGVSWRGLTLVTCNLVMDGSGTI